MSQPVAPFPYQVLFSYLERRATPGKEAVQGMEYQRFTAQGTVVFDAKGTVTVRNPDRPATAEEISHVERLFFHHQEWVTPPFLEQDPVLGPLIAQTAGIRPLGAWDPWELCLRTVVGQQVSVAAAKTLMARVGTRSGDWTAEAVAAAPLDGIGMPGRRIQTLQSLAEKAAAGDLPWQAPWPDLREAFARIPGIGPWTLDYLGIRLGRDLDAFPSTDLGLIRGAGVRSPRELLQKAEAWRPFRGWAAAYLWMAPPRVIP